MEKDTGRRKLIIIIIALAVAIATVSAVFVFFAFGDSARIQRKMRNAERYLEELDYEQAEAAYQDVLKIDPKNADAYLGLVEVYTAQEDYDAALECAKEGYDVTQDERLKKQISKLEKMLQPEDETLEKTNESENVAKVVDIKKSDYKNLNDELFTLALWLADSDSFNMSKKQDYIYSLALYAMTCSDIEEYIEVDPLNRVNQSSEIYNDTAVMNLEDLLWIIQNKLNLTEYTLDDLREFDSENFDADNWFAYVLDDTLYFCPIPMGSGLEETEPEYSILSEKDDEVYVKCDFLDITSGSGEYSIYAVGCVKEDSQNQRFWSFTYWGTKPCPDKSDENTIEDADESTDDDMGWKEAYKTILNNYHSDFGDPRFCLAYIDSDNIPELLISVDGSHAGSVCVYTYYNDKAKEVGYYGEYGTITFAERENRIYSGYAGMGSEFLSVYEINRGKEKELVNLEGYLEEYVEEGDVPPNCYINSQVVSKEQYDTAYDMYYGSISHTVITYEDCLPITSKNVNDVLK